MCYNDCDELLFLQDVNEPTSYSMDTKDENWVKAMKSEVDVIERNHTWNLLDLRPGRRPIRLKWVYKLKRDPNGNVIKHKARLVAKGYVQKHIIDYDEVIAPIARLETVRILLALLGKNRWKVHHLDVKSTFLNGDLEEEVYVSQPEGFVKRDQPRKVYKLSKALYGLRQAPRAWNARLYKCLRGLGFVKCLQEHAVYTKNRDRKLIIIGIYVDDLIVTGNCDAEVEEFKAQMNREFEMSNLGTLSYYLEIEVVQREGEITLKQATYARNLLTKTGWQIVTHINIRWSLSWS